MNHEAIIIYIERATGKKTIEKVYGAKALELFYSTSRNRFTKLFGNFLKSLIAQVSFFSWVYGLLQKTTFSKRKIIPFIKEFGIDTSEFQNPSTFRSFNDFFIRKLHKESRPIVSEKNVAVIPADGRYFFYQDVTSCEGFIVKGKKFTLEKLLLDIGLANKYENGSMAMARLCPVDYHRFHFPCDGMPSSPKLINGPLYSVNPIAIRNNLSIFTENKRMITSLQSDEFGDVLYIEIGATFVGGIHQTYSSGKHVKKGDEKGFFSFGGSALILLFEPNSLLFDRDLLEASKAGLEIKCLMGQSMGKSIK